MSGESFKDVGRKLQRRREKVQSISKVSGESFKGVGRRLQRCRKKASKVSEKASKMLEGQNLLEAND